MWPITRRLLLSVLASTSSRMAITAAAAPSRPFTMAAHASSVAAPAASRASAANDQIGKGPTVVYQQASLTVDRQQIPVSLWLPAADGLTRGAPVRNTSVVFRLLAANGMFFSLFRLYVL
eukprot:6194564-Pleurochrysis_carterae.AAC.1